MKLGGVMSYVRTRNRWLLSIVLGALVLISLRALWAAPSFQAWRDVRHGEAKFFYVSGPPLPPGKSEPASLTAQEKHLMESGVQLVGIGCVGLTAHELTYNEYVVEYFGPVPISQSGPGNHTP